jgi:site-specific DNA recombinase
MPQPQIIGYGRASAPNEQTDSVSLPAQESAVRAWCEQRNFQLLAWVADDGVSGSVPIRERCHGKMAIDQCEIRRLQLVVHALDRAFRRLSDYATTTEFLLEHGSNFLSVTEPFDLTTTPGRMFGAMLAAMAEFRRNTDSDQIRSRKAQRKKMGLRSNNVAEYGFEHYDTGRVTDKVVAIIGERPCQAELQLIRVVLDFKSHHYSLAQIAEKLNTGGFKTRHGGEWSKGTVNDLVKSGKERLKRAREMGKETIATGKESDGTNLQAD